MKLIKELFQDVRYLEEASEDGKKSLYIEGIFMQSDKANKNGRLYPRSIMEKEVNRYQELIKKKGHSESLVILQTQLLTSTKSHILLLN
jgi:hypothetical protein